MPSVSNDTAGQGTSPDCWFTLPLPSDPDALLALVHRADAKQRLLALTDYHKYEVRPGGVVAALDTLEEFSPEQFIDRKGHPAPYHNACSCSSHRRYVLPLLDALATARMATTCRCVHSYVRDLSYGLPIYIGDVRHYSTDNKAPQSLDSTGGALENQRK